MSVRICLIGLVFFCWSCQNIEDAKPAERNTFIHFYEAPHNVYGVAAEPVDGGYIILGNELLANGNQNTLFIKTDKNGLKIGNDVVIPGGSVKSLKVGSDGYYIMGDSIKLNLESSEGSVFDLVVNSARIFKLDFNGNVMQKLVIADKQSTQDLTDFFGGALTFDENGNLIVLGTFKNAGQGTKQKPFLAALDPSTLSAVWSKNYDILDRDYVNAKSVHISPNGRVIWATALLKENQNFSRSYMGIPYIEPNSTFENFSQYGEQTDQQLYSNDIQPNRYTGLGYGIVGTYASPTGLNSNLFFATVNPDGDINEGSIRYFDGQMTATNTVGGADQSESEDSGDAIIATQDGGFVLGGSMTTTPVRGNGGKDIFLVKVDRTGKMLWNKVLGGLGDETVSSIRETSDGGLLICGSNNASGLSSIFIMKTDKNGELQN